AAARASCSKRRSRSESAERKDGKTLIATSRPSRESRARYTSPIPPEPSSDLTSYSPSFVPGASVTRSAEDCRKLERTSGLEASRVSTSCRKDGSDEQARSRKAGRSPGASSSAFSSTSRISCQRSGVMRLLPCSSGGAAKAWQWPNVFLPSSARDSAHAQFLRWKGRRKISARQC